MDTELVIGKFFTQVNGVDNNARHAAVQRNFGRRVL